MPGLNVGARKINSKKKKKDRKEQSQGATVRRRKERRKKNVRGAKMSIQFDREFIYGYGTERRGNAFEIDANVIRIRA